MIVDGQHVQQTPRCNRADAIDPAAARSGDALSDTAKCYELRFQSLFDSGRGFAFPCDAAGHIDLDALSETARNNYFYAHGVVGREFHIPTVLHVPLH